MYWVTHAGENELDVPLLLRPTSETAMYPIFSLWIRSHADLPLKTYQIVNVFRYETKQTRAFIRMREIHFFEAHTCHADFEDAERQIREDMEMWEEIAKTLKEDEQKIYKAIIEAGGIIEQSKLPEKTGLSKSSVSRALDLLESKGLVERKRRGMGNIVLLK